MSCVQNRPRVREFRVAILVRDAPYRDWEALRARKPACASVLTAFEGERAEENPHARPFLHTTCNGFDYRRANMATSAADRVRRGRAFAVVDEASSTPITSSGSGGSAEVA